MTWFAIGTGAEALAAAGGWNETLYRAWYLTGAVWTAAWLGLGTAFLLGRTRFGYTYAVLLLLSGLVALMIRNNPAYAGAGPLPLLYLIGAVILALAIGVETYFGNDTWPRFAAGAIVGVTLLSIVLMVLTPPLPAPGLRAEPGDRAARGRRDAGLPAAAHAGHEHPRRAGAAPGRRVLGVRLHAQEAGAGLLARPEPAGRPVPVQPAHRPGRDRGQPGRVAARRGARPGGRPAPLAGAGDHPDRDRRVLPDHHGLPQPGRLHRAVPAGQVPGRRVPVRRVPRLVRGVPRDPHPVHAHPPRDAPPGARPPARPGGRRGPRGAGAPAPEAPGPVRAACTAMLAGDDTRSSDAGPTPDACGPPDQLGTPRPWTALGPATPRGSCSCTARG